jgi:hypothetical protein
VQQRKMVFACSESAHDGSEPSHALNNKFIVDNVRHCTVGMVEDIK